MFYQNSKLLDAGVDYGVFSYHPKCKKIQLTHFADDQQGNNNRD